MPAIAKHTDLKLLADKATQLRIDSVRATTEAGSGHPTSCASAADIVSVLFFSVMKFDPRNPRSDANDIFVLSKGHAAPLLYAAWAEAGFLHREDLLKLRKLDSELEGHPTPRLPFVDVATGSLGQGLSVGIGIALHAKRYKHVDQRVYVLIGDGESAEGSVWEAAQWASMHRLNNLCVTLDINRLGQSQPTMLQHHVDAYEERWKSFGWQTLPVDGHNIEELLEAYDKARHSTRPTIVLARTIKGKGLAGIEGKEGWHGKALDRDAANQVISQLSKQITEPNAHWQPNLPSPVKESPPPENLSCDERVLPPYSLESKEVSTRKAFADGLAALGCVNPRVVALDGDVKNSTYTEEFEKLASDRFFECYIAEQNMIGIAMGLAARGEIPFASTFACFLTRAYDFVRMAAISNLNVKLVGTHAGISIGEDGPSQMGLEDLAMFCAEPNFTVLYPSDATSAWRAPWLLAERPGPGYLRAGRPNSPILYRRDEHFEIGKCKILRQSGEDVAMIVAAGVTVFEALEAYEQLLKEGRHVRVIDLFSVQPIDREELIASAKACHGNVITVEDHYQHGGIGDAVLSALAQERVGVHKLAVREIPRSGKPKELLERFGISARHIIDAVKAVR